MPDAGKSVVLDRELDEEKSQDPSGPRIRCPYAAGRLARKTNGFAPAAMTGTLSIREACALHAFISGPKLNAFPVAAGRRIRFGTRNNQMQGICGRLLKFPAS